MAERAAKLAAEKAEKERREREQWGGFLDGFDAPKSASPAAPAKPASPAPSQPMLAPTPQPAVARTASPLSKTASPTTRSPAPKPGSFWDTDAAKSATPANDNHDDLDDFLGGSSTPAQVKPTGGDLLGGTSGGDAKPTGGPSDPWDFDALAASVPSSAEKPKESSHDRPSDFDYGNDFAEDDDDLLGGLGSGPAVSCCAFVDN